MPEVGDQHNGVQNAANPFEEPKPHISEYTAQEIATLSSRLEKQLGPEYISSRPGAAGQKVHYLAADKCINLANEVFGFNGWSSAIKQIQIDYVDESQSTGKVSLGLSVIVRVTLRDGTYHEDIGYGHIENAKGKAAAFEKAKKEGTTDALKRALRNFGNILGNCVYDKEYVAKVTRIKVAPSRWDPENLHRHQDYAPVRKVGPDESARATSTTAIVEGPISETIRRNGSYGEDEFGADDFDEVDFNAAQDEEPDGIVLDDSGKSEHFPPKPLHGHLPPPPNHVQRTATRSDLAPQTPSRAPNTRPLNSGPVLGNGANNLSNPTQIAKALINPAQGNSTRTHNQPQPVTTPSMPLPQVPRDTNKTTTSDPSADLSNPTSSDTLPLSAPLGFFTAKVAESVQKGALNPQQTPTFDLHGESPSIRKTAGIDHSVSKPVRHEAIGANLTTTSNNSATATAPGARPLGNGSNHGNPQVDRMRRVGMPPNVGSSPLGNRGNYRPPQIMKRPATEQQGRPPLADVTNGAATVAAEPMRDGKRARVEGGTLAKFGV